MKRVFLEGDAQTLFSDARLDAVRRIGAEPVKPPETLGGGIY
jgi:hypothetical protein